MILDGYGEVLKPNHGYNTESIITRRPITRALIAFEVNRPLCALFSQHKNSNAVLLLMSSKFIQSNAKLRANTQWMFNYFKTAIE